MEIFFPVKISQGESLTDDIRRYFNRKTDGVEYATDVLDSNDWLVENRACRPISSEGKCVWHNYKDLSDGTYLYYCSNIDWRAN